MPPIQPDELVPYLPDPTMTPEQLAECVWFAFRGRGPYLPPIPGVDPRIQKTIGDSVIADAKKMFVQGYFLGKGA